jgi:hypothetical protein
MWEQYRKRFWGMQLVIALITLAAYRFGYASAGPALEFFAVMQVASLFGGYWAFRIKQRYSTHV